MAPVAPSRAAAAAAAALVAGPVCHLHGTYLQNVTGSTSPCCRCLLLLRCICTRNLESSFSRAMALEESERHRAARGTCHTHGE